MDPRTERLLNLTRRQLLTQGLCAGATAALASISGSPAASAKTTAAGAVARRRGALPGLPHQPPSDSSTCL